MHVTIAMISISMYVSIYAFCSHSNMCRNDDSDSQRITSNAWRGILNPVDVRMCAR